MLTFPKSAWSRRKNRGGVGARHGVITGGVLKHASVRAGDRERRKRHGEWLEPWSRNDGARTAQTYFQRTCLR